MNRCPLPFVTLLCCCLLAVAVTAGCFPSPVEVDGSGVKLQAEGPLSAEEQALVMKIAKGKTCEVCHRHDETRTAMKAPGFLFTSKNLPARLEPKNYQRVVDSLKKNDPKRFDKGKDVLEGILAETSSEKRMQQWLTAYLKDPKFDNPKNTMNKIALSDAEIGLLARYVIHLKDQQQGAASKK